jgi:alpha-tubulin suppressor-like RCC1 family protein
MSQVQTQIFIRDNIPGKEILLNSIKDCISTHIIDKTFDISAYSLSDSTRLGFVYENNIPFIPFGKGQLIINDITFIFFSRDFFNLISQTVNRLDIDLITCELYNTTFISEVFSLKTILPNVNINYSLNTTGGKILSDWITESNDISIKNIYFNSNIDNYVFALGGGSNDHSAFIRNDFSVWTFGFNVYGQLGDGTTLDSNTPLKVPGIIGVAHVACGSGHTIVVTNTGDVWGFGKNQYGQLGNGTIDTAYVPFKLTTINSAKYVACGYDVTVIVKYDGSVWAFGDNLYGQLCDGTSENYRTLPIQMQTEGINNIIQVTCGSSFTIVLTSDGNMYGVGDNSFGQLGIGPTPTSTTSFIQISLSGIISIASGSNHTIAVKNDGTVYGFGLNDDGQIGITTLNYSNVPVQIAGIISGIYAAAGRSHSVILLDNGTVNTIGYNYYGELGTGDTLSYDTVQTLLGANNIISVSAGNQHTAILRNDGTMQIVGYGEHGQLGDGSYDNQTGLMNVLTTGSNGKVFRIFDADISSTFCVRQNNLVSTKNGLTQIQNIKSGDIVHGENNEEIIVKYNIKMTIPTRKFIKIKKNAFEKNVPRNDLFIVPGHPVKYKSEEINCDKLVGTVNGVLNGSLHKPYYVYCLCTEERVFVNIEGVPVCTRTEKSWNEITNKKRIFWTKQ